MSVESIQLEQLSRISGMMKKREKIWKRYKAGLYKNVSETPYAAREVQEEVIVKVYLDNTHEKVVEVPITPETQAADVVDCCKEAGEEQCHLAELWRGCERPIGDEEHIYEILQQWGIHKDEVRFYLRHESAAPLGNSDGRRIHRKNGVRTTEGGDNMLPSGVDLTLTELQEMADRQQAQLESQQQMLVAKEQRLKFLKQQEMRHQQVANENDRLRKLREKVENQEMKLKKLRALKGEVNEYKNNNTSLTSELESIKALFNEKEKELSVAVAKVENLTQQLEELRRGSNNENNKKSPAENELDKLKQELMLRNKLNEQQNSKLAAHREVLSQRKDEMAKMDRRISELQARLRRKRALAEQRNNMISNKSTAGTNKNRPLSANIAAVEPYIQRAPQEPREENLKPEGGYPINKQDPKYQTLPHSIKFPGGGDSVDNNNKGEPGKINSSLGYKGVNNQQGNMTSSLAPTFGPGQMGSSARQPSPTGRSSAGIMSNFAPKPYGSMGSFSTALTVSSRTGGGDSSPIYTSPAGNAPGPKTSTPITPGGETRTSAMKEIFITGAPHQGPPPSRPPPQPPGGTGKSYLGNSTPAPYPGSGLGSIGSTATTPASTASSMTSQGGNVSRPPGPPNYAASMANRLQPPNLGPGGPGREGNNPPSPSSSSSSQGYYKPTTQPPPNPPAGGASTAGQARTAARGPTPTGRGDLFIPRSAASTYPGNRQVSNSGNNNNWHQQQPGNHSNDTSGRLSSTTGSTSVNTTTGSGAEKPRDLPTSQGTTAQEGTTDGDKAPDTSPTSVMSALDILKAGGPMGNAGPKTYRYAPKSVIANTYMRKLGSSTLEKYRQNMSALYKDFVPGVSQGGAQGAEAKTPGSPTATVRPLQQGQGQGQDAGYDRLSNGPAYPGGEAEKRYRPNAPRPLRRRLSQEGTTEEYPSQRQSSRLSPTQEGAPGFHSNRPQSPPGADDVFVTSSNNSSGGAQVVRIDHIYDSYDSAHAQDSKSSLGQSSHGSDSTSGVSTETSSSQSERGKNLPAPLRNKKTNLKKKDSVRNSRRVSFDPLALLLDASLEGELELVMRTAKEVTDPSAPNDEGITALHNAICAGHYGIVKFLIEFGCNVNAPDSDGWTPLHCAASCNNLPMVRFLVEHGACIFATTISDHETAAEKCEEDEDGFDGCSEYLYSIQEKLGILNHGKVYAVFDYISMNSDELTFETNEELVVLRKGDETEMEWWWARKGSREGYIPRNLLGLTPRVEPQWLKNEKNSTK